MGEQAKVTIVVADDFSEIGKLALSYALDQGRAMVGDLHVVHVVTEADLDAMEGATRLEKLDSLFAKLPQRLWDRIGTAGKSVEGLAEMRITVHVRVGHPSDEIDRTAADYGAHMIVVGTHGRKGIERLVLGSVAEKLVRQAHCPVVVVRPRDFEGVRKSERPEPARPGEDLHSTRPELPHHYHSSQIINFRDFETTGFKF